MQGMNSVKRLGALLRRTTRGLAVLGLGTAVITGPHLAAAQDLPQTLYIASGQAGSLQHTVASAIAKVLSDELPTTVVVRPYSGTTAYFPILDAGDVEFGLAPSVDFALSFQGPDRLRVGDRNPYPQTPNLRLVASGSSLIAGMVVRKDSDMKTVGDLRDARLAGNYSAHLGAYINSYAHLLNAGLTWDDVGVVPVAGLNQGLDALTNGRVQGAVYGAGAPRIREADAAVGVRFLPNLCDDAAKKRVTDVIPGYTFITLPEGRLPGIVEDTCITAYPLYLVTSTHTGDDIVAAITEALHKNAHKLAEFHPVLRGWKAETSVREDVTLPYHDAAKGVYQAAGAWSDAVEKTNSMLLEQ